MPVGPTPLDAMVASLGRRGPDAAAVWYGRTVGLGQTTLRSSPRPAGDEGPRDLRHRDLRHRDLVLAADARIDNRGELLKTLDLAPYDDESVVDEQIILAAYARWRETCPNMLLGDFAFAIWDAREELLFCARDHFGVKPFYYYRSRRRFVFASEVRAVLSSGATPRRINEARIADYLVEGLEGHDKTSSFYHDIWRLEPGHAISIRPARTRKWRYWNLQTSPPSRYRSDAEYRDAFREVFTEAVRCRLRTSKPPASMLSGGLDSSSIVAIADQLLAEQGRRPLRTLSATAADGVNCPESACIRAMRQRKTLDSFAVTRDDLSGYRDEMSPLLYHCDEPFDVEIALPQVMYVAAKRMGSNVLLDGLDGDIVVSLGSRCLSHLLRRGKWRSAWKEARRQRQSDPTLSAASLLYRAGRAAFVPFGLSGIRERLGLQRHRDDHLGTSIINREFAREVRLEERLEALWAHGQTASVSNIHQYHAQDINHPYLVVALERYDRVASFYSIEPRHPFLDKRLVELCVGLPWWQCVGDGWSKIILRQSIGDLLPQQVRWRKGKEHLGWEFRLGWLLLEKDTLAGLMADDLNEISRYVDVPLVRGAYARCVSHGWETCFVSEQPYNDAVRVWTAMALALWHRSHVTAPASRVLMSPT